MTPLKMLIDARSVESLSLSSAGVPVGDGTGGAAETAGGAAGTAGAAGTEAAGAVTVAVNEMEEVKLASIE